MPEASAPTNRWLVEEFSARLAQVFESMAGQRPPVGTEAQKEPPSAAASSYFWKQAFSGLNGAIWLVAAEADWTAAGMHILAGAGMGPEDCDAGTTKSSYSETLAQALGGLGQALSARLRREVTPAGGKQMQLEELPSSWNTTEWSHLKFTLGDKTASLYAGVENALADSVHAEEADNAQEPKQLSTIDTGSARPGAFDLLLDVELPISVSFGMAEVPLKDVLKLTTGSIVELNRTILEPVEVVVNNCVIARGEVVVVEGNFGVRIKQVISRQDRLRSLR